MHPPAIGVKVGAHWQSPAEQTAPATQGEAAGTGAAMHGAPRATGTAGTTGTTGGTTP